MPAAGSFTSIAIAFSPPYASVNRQVVDVFAYAYARRPPIFLRLRLVSGQRRRWRAHKRTRQRCLTCVCLRRSSRSLDVKKSSCRYAHHVDDQKNLTDIAWLCVEPGAFFADKGVGRRRRRMGREGNRRCTCGTHWVPICWQVDPAHENDRHVNAVYTVAVVITARHSDVAHRRAQARTQRQPHTNSPLSPAFLALSDTRAQKSNCSICPVSLRVRRMVRVEASV
jgi:hypothetical protein